MRNFSLLLASVWVVAISIILFGCDSQDEYYSDVFEVKLSSKIAECEEWNVFLRVDSVSLKQYEYLLGDYVLPNCTNADCEDRIYSLKHEEIFEVFIVKGRLSKEPHDVKDYGCPTFHSFEVQKVISEYTDKE